MLRLHMSKICHPHVMELHPKVPDHLLLLAILYDLLDLAPQILADFKS